VAPDLDADIGERLDAAEGQRDAVRPEQRFADGFFDWSHDSIRLEKETLEPRRHEDTKVIVQDGECRRVFWEH
jgi:hypothetical protein